MSIRHSCMFLSMSPIGLRYPMTQTFYLVTAEYTFYYYYFLIIFSCIERSVSMLVQYDQSIVDLNNSWKILKLTPCLYVKVLQQLKKISELELRLWLWQFYVVDLIIFVPTKYTDWINIQEEIPIWRKCIVIRYGHSSWQTSTIFISQEQYISTMMEKFSNYGLSKCSTPMDARRKKMC